MKPSRFLITGIGSLAGLSLLGLAGCKSLFARPLPADPPHDIVIEYNFSAGMTPEWTYIAITPDELRYRSSMREAAEYVAFAMDAGRFETLYRTLRALHPETIHSEPRSVPANDYASTDFLIHAASTGYRSRARIDGSSAVPAGQARRFRKIVEAIRNTAREVVAAARRPVSICIDAGKETTVTYLKIGNHVVENLQGNPVCTRVALLDRQRYLVQLLFRERNAVLDDTRAAAHSFALEPATRRIEFLRKHNQLHRIIPDSRTPREPE